MFIEKIKTDGLAHLSYLVGDKDQAVAIDPRRDTRIYEQLASQHGCQLVAIFETHRNEDLISGAPVLATRTGATVYHGPNAAGEIEYANIAEEGFEVRIGRLLVKVLATPGHTLDSISLALYDTEADNQTAIAVFTGDTLFIGDVGRTDFYPERSEEMAGLLHDSIEKLLALGDHTLLYPAHGAGSVCGGNLSSREFSTLGHERLTNPVLKLLGDKDAFIARKTNEHHYKPPYFKLMEERNLKGDAPVLAEELNALSYRQLKKLDDCKWIDIRTVESFSGHHIEGTLSLPVKFLASYAGWLLKPHHNIVLLAEDPAQVEEARAHLYRIGYDNLKGYWQMNTNRWASESGKVSQLQHLSASELASALRTDEAPQLLDVRAYSEWQSTGIIPGAFTAYLGELKSKLGGLRSDKPVVTVCASGQRATVAASILRQRGFRQVRVLWGGINAWRQDYTTEPYTH